MTEENSSQEDVKQDAVQTSESATEHNIPQARLNKEIDKRKKAESEAQAEREARIRAEARAEALAERSDENEEEDNDDVKFVKKTALETAQRVSKESLSSVKEEVKADIRRETEESNFFSNLSEGLPKPDMDDIEDFQREKGIRSKIDAYKLMHANDIRDNDIRQALKNSKGLVSEEGSKVNTADLEQRIRDAKSSKEIDALMKEAGYN